MGLIIQSFLIGFTAAATLGPIALVCIQRTLKSGWRVGAASGLGVAMADATYGLVGALGLSALTQFLLDFEAVIRLAGGAVLVALGVRVMRSFRVVHQVAEEPGLERLNYFSAVGSIYLLTLSNPVTILFFSAVYAGLSLSGSSLGGISTVEVGGFTLGVFAGSLSWWLILVSFISAIRRRFQLSHLYRLNLVSGMAITGFGIWVFIQLLLGRN